MSSPSRYRTCRSSLDSELYCRLAAKEDEADEEEDKVKVPSRLAQNEAAAVKRSERSRPAVGTRRACNSKVREPVRTAMSMETLPVCLTLRLNVELGHVVWSPDHPLLAPDSNMAAPNMFECNYCDFMVIKNSHNNN